MTKKIIYKNNKENKNENNKNNKKIKKNPTSKFGLGVGAGGNICSAGHAAHNNARGEPRPVAHALFGSQFRQPGVLHVALSLYIYCSLSRVPGVNFQYSLRLLSTYII
jgi:hypothetical protein